MHHPLTPADPHPDRGVEMELCGNAATAFPLARFQRMSCLVLPQNRYPGPHLLVRWHLHGKQPHEYCVLHQNLLTTDQVPHLNIVVEEDEWVVMYQYENRSVDLSLLLNNNKN